MHRYLLILFTLLCLNIHGKAQSFSEEDKVYRIFDVDTLPDFPGGQQSLNKYIFDSLSLKEFEVCPGTVMISFIVEKDGSLSGFRVVRPLCPTLDEAVMEVARAMPDWKAGYKNGKTVRVQVNLPVKFGHNQIIKTD